MTERTTATPLLDTYLELFCHRRDVFAQQTKSGSYFVRHQPVTHQIIDAHLTGRLTAGWYALTPDNTTRWVVLDADRADGLEQLKQAWQQLDQQGIPSYLEGSRRGGHLWLLFPPSTLAATARRFIHTAVSNLDGIELFPKRDRLEPGVPLGNLVRGPLGIHRRSGRRHPFVDPISLKPVASTVRATLEYLAGSRRVDIGELEDESRTEADRRESSTPEQWYAMSGSRLRGSEPRGRRSTIELLKRQIGDPYAFISQFVDLDERGRGRCPFHPPDRHPSFAVNRAGGYWVCFHEVSPSTGHYIGGDAIEFFRRIRSLTHREALEQLQHLMRETS